LEASGNPYIISLTTGVQAAVNTTTMFKQRERPLPRDPVPDHIAVFEAVAAGDPDRAHREMSTLVHLALQDTPLPRARAKRSAD
jgi:DNA-binding FadR family transcriptional regulator